MKIRFLFLLGLVSGWPYISYAEICNDLSQCLGSCFSGYCCEAGYTGTILSCPDGWSLTTNTSGVQTCSRTAAAESDERGEYNQYYSSCAPTENTGECYIRRSTTSGTSAMCTMCRQVSGN
ncbi:MAG TPA: hypothetical protein IAD02_04325 [Candidatus Enterousia intestinigallinarum]|uniref:Uncharacterized protein n=1 Tax=Candidatus Enterousia intestinigallinarum TaxID=2840790 RepID=A0A9D1FGB1_9PROT|nr:hypothetical protein [Candidatus Enterousia intestinigallinarum]